MGEKIAVKPGDMCPKVHLSCPARVFEKARFGLGKMRGSPRGLGEMGCAFAPNALLGYGLPTEWFIGVVGSELGWWGVAEVYPAQPAPRILMGGLLGG